MRWAILCAGAAVVAGAAFVTASIPPRAGGGENEKVEPKAVGLSGPKTGYFNMVRVMRESKRSAGHVAAVGGRHERALAQLNGLRRMHAELLAAAQLSPDAAVRSGAERDAAAVGRLIAEAEQRHAANAAGQGHEIVAEIYSEMQAAAAELARARGLSVLMAYPAPASPADAANPAIMELALKPPAAYPFYLDPALDYTDELLERLNAKFAADAGVR